MSPILCHVTSLVHHIMCAVIKYHLNDLNLNKGTGIQTHQEVMCPPLLLYTSLTHAGVKHRYKRESSWARGPRWFNDFNLNKGTGVQTHQEVMCPPLLLYISLTHAGVKHRYKRESSWARDPAGSWGFWLKDRMRVERKGWDRMVLKVWLGTTEQVLQTGTGGAHYPLQDTIEVTAYKAISMAITAQCTSLNKDKLHHCYSSSISQLQWQLQQQAFQMLRGQLSKSTCLQPTPLLAQQLSSGNTSIMAPVLYGGGLTSSQTTSLLMDTLLLLVFIRNSV